MIMNAVNKTDNRSPEQAQAVRYMTPLVDIVETKEGYILEAEMPGVAKEGLEIELDRNELTLVGHRSPMGASAQAVYRESQGHDYRRVFELDPTIESTRISAQMDQGVLRLVLPKVEHAKPRKITVSD
jgi:HSP20 family protein